MPIEKFLKKAGVNYDLHKHPKAFTAQELAHEEHVSGHAVAKSVVVHAGDQPVLCVLPASCRADLAKLAEQLGVGACRLVDEAEMKALFPDAEVGAEPPFGNLYNLEMIVDEHLTEKREIVFDAGTHHESIRMDFGAYESLTHPTKADIAVHL